MPETFDKLFKDAIDLGLHFIAAVFIFIIGRWGAKIASEVVEKLMGKAGLHRTLTSFARHLSFYAIMTFVLIATLNKVGVETSSFIAVVGAASLAVGLALQGSLANFASGVMLILLQPFRLGDHIEAGGANGTVEEIQIFNTVLITPDNKKIIIPNSKVTSDKITIFPADHARA